MDAYAPRILIVDDSIDAADSLAELVNLWGFDAEAHYGGAAALESARQDRPDIILLDLNMPRMCGFEFVRLLRELRGGEKVEFVVISGSTSGVYQQRARSLGIEHYLFKPVDLEELQSLLSFSAALLEQRCESLPQLAGHARLEMQEEPSRRDVNHRIPQRTDSRELLQASGNSLTR